MLCNGKCKECKMNEYEGKHKDFVPTDILVHIYEEWACDYCPFTISDDNILVADWESYNAMPA